jgi:hypothetical protein
LRGTLALIVVLLGGCAVGAVYLHTRPAPVRYDSVGRIRTDGRLDPPKLPSATLPGVSFGALVTSLHDITGIHTEYSVELVVENGFVERLPMADGVSLTVSAHPARSDDGTYSASCLYDSSQQPIVIDAAKISLVRSCALAALPQSDASAAIAWLAKSRARTEVKQINGVWVTAYRASTDYGVLVSAD